MRQYFTVDNTPAFIKFFISLGLLAYVENLNQIHSFTRLIVILLEFMIILELVRMLVEFVFSDDNRIKLRFMIDSTIIFFIRDIMLVANHNFEIKKIASMLGVVLVLFIFRILTMKYSPEIIET